MKLVKGRQNRQEALSKFHELAAVQVRPADTPGARVVDLVESFLTWVKREYDRETWRA